MNNKKNIVLLTVSIVLLTFALRENSNLFTIISLILSIILFISLIYSDLKRK